MVSQLVAAINPDDLDALDDNLPLAKVTVDNLLGRVHTPVEYQFYFERNPHAALYLDVYPVFFNEERSARSVVSIQDQKAREARAGYRDGKKPSNAIVNVAPQLTQHTNAAMTRLGMTAQPIVAQAFVPPPMAPQYSQQFQNQPPLAYAQPVYGFPAQNQSNPPPPYAAATHQGPPPPYVGR